MSFKYYIEYVLHTKPSDYIDLLNEKLSKLNFEYDSKNPEYIFILGGDGTFLNLSKKYLNSNVKIIMLNTGNVGFYSSCELEEIENYILSKNYYKNVNYLKIKIDNKFFYALNEITTFSFNAFPIDLILDKKPWYRLFASGLIISTSLGSSGSNKSNFGPLVDTQLDTLILTEILNVNNIRFCSLNAPIVLSSKRKLEIKWNMDKNMEIAIDNQKIDYKYSKILLELSKSKAKILISKDFVINKWPDSFIKK